MISVPYAGYNYYHQDGWEITRPDGIRHYTIIFIRNPFYYVIKEGEELKTIYVERPSFLFYRPTDYQHFYLHGAPYTDDWIHFSGDDEEIAGLFEELELPFSVLYKISDIKKKNIDNAIDFTSGTIEGYRRRFNILRNRIYQGGEAARIREVSALAEEMNMSVSYFQHVYKALYGVSVTKDIIISRIEYASYLLLNQNTTISETAAFCGYDSIEHFNRQFKKLKGCSPNEYKKSHDR